MSEFLDLRGLNCPVPLLKTKQAIARMESGDELLVWCTDKAAPIDFRSYCAVTGHELVLLKEHSDYFEIKLRCFRPS